MYGVRCLGDDEAIIAANVCAVGVSRSAGREVVQGCSRDEAISSAGQWHDGGRGEYVRTRLQLVDQGPRQCHRPRID